MTKSDTNSAMDIQDIMEYLPHRYPFLLIDRVLEFHVMERIVAIKNVTANEPHFTGHFPDRPILPGVIILEAMAQAAGLLAFKSVGKKPDKNSLYLFVGIDKARFRRPVTPGDQLVFELTMLQQKRGLWKFRGTAKVDGELACEAELMSTHRSTI